MFSIRSGEGTHTIFLWYGPWSSDVGTFLDKESRLLFLSRSRFHMKRPRMRWRQWRGIWSTVKILCISRRRKTEKCTKNGGWDCNICTTCAVGDMYAAAGESNVEAAQMLTKGRGGRRVPHTSPPLWLWTQKTIAIIIVGSGGEGGVGGGFNQDKQDNDWYWDQDGGWGRIWARKRCPGREQSDNIWQWQYCCYTLSPPSLPPPPPSLLLLTFYLWDGKWYGRGARTTATT